MKFLLLAFTIMTAAITAWKFNSEDTSSAQIQNPIIEESIVVESIVVESTEASDDVAASLEVEIQKQEAQQEVIEITEIKTEKKVTIEKTVIAKKVVVKKVVAKKVEAKIEDTVELKQASMNKVEMNLKQKAAKPTKKIFTGGVNFSTTTDLKEFSNETKSYAGSMGVSIGYQINDTYKAKISTSISKDLSTSFEEKQGNTNLSLSHSAISLSDKTKLVPVVTGIYPTSKASKVKDEMNGGVAFTTVFIHSITSSLSFSLATNAAVYSHKFKTNRANVTNTQYTLSESGGFEYSITDNLSLGLSLSFAQMYSYYGTQKGDQYSTELGASYSLGKAQSLSAGLSTGGLLYEAEQGPDASIELYDADATSFYLVYGISL